MSQTECVANRLYLLGTVHVLKSRVLGLKGAPSAFDVGLVDENILFMHVSVRVVDPVVVKSMPRQMRFHLQKIYIGGVGVRADNAARHHVLFQFLHQIVFLSIGHIVEHGDLGSPVS